MLTTRFTELVGCTTPVQLAGMGGMTSPELVAAVSNAGGLGMIAAVQLNEAAIVSAFQSIRGLTSGKVGLNFLVPFVNEADVEAGSALADVVEFFFGEPDANLVARAHQHNALVSWQVGSVDEAKAAVDVGCDFLIAQGVEAGGHVRGTQPVQELLEAVCQFTNVPVLAAGGVSTGTGLAATIKLGGDGVRIGSRFLLAHESVAHPTYIAALLASGADDTVHTLAYSGGWPEAPHRVLKSCIEAATALPSDEPVGTSRIGDQDVPVPRFNVAPPNIHSKGRVDAMCLYAGESIEFINTRESAREIVLDVVTQAEAQLEPAGDDI